MRGIFVPFLAKGPLPLTLPSPPGTLRMQHRNWQLPIRGEITTMRLEQGQVWKQGELFYRIVQLERKAVEYKEMLNKVSFHGTHRYATKKDFCRLIKGATLLKPSEY